MIRYIYVHTACPSLPARVVIRLSLIVCIRVVIFSGVCLERRLGGKGGKKEENIAKQSDHVLKP